MLAITLPSFAAMQPLRGRSVYAGDMRNATMAILLTACGGPRSPEPPAPKPASEAPAALPAYASAEAIT
ncbi:MAG: hypothetical protein ACREBE_17700, partial [bacterium]